MKIRGKNKKLSSLSPSVGLSVCLSDLSETKPGEKMRCLGGGFSSAVQVGSKCSVDCKRQNDHKLLFHFVSCDNIFVIF